MSCFDSKLLCNICIVRLQGHLLLTSDNMIWVFCLGTKRKQFMWTQVFLTDCILRNDAVNSMSFLLSQTSTGFSSAEVLLTNLATFLYLRELNLINQPKTLTVLVVLVSHQIINNIIEATRSVELPILQYSSRKNSKKFSSSDQLISMNSYQLPTSALIHNKFSELSASQTLWSWN